MTSHYCNKITILNPEPPHDVIATTLALIDTGAIHGSYAGSWLLTHKLRVGNNFSKSQICSPINNTCVPLSDSVIACVDIYDVDNKFKLNYEMEFKILSSLDDREYGIIIGLPDIKRHKMLDHFANQFIIGGKDTHERKRCKVDLLDDIPLGNTLSDKFASLSEIQCSKHKSKELQRTTLLRINSPNTITYSTGLTQKYLSHDDMPSNVIWEEIPRYMFNVNEEKIPRHIFRPPSTYDEDEEVIDYYGWDDAWQKKTLLTPSSTRSVPQTQRLKSKHTHYCQSTKTYSLVP